MSNTDYGFLARLLHRVALGSPRMGRLWFDIEQSRAEKSSGAAPGPAVFIAGMARSGSTILLNALHSTGKFRSLTYRDMPFILMSGTWKGLSSGSRAQAEKKERAHGDRLLVDYDSPEAFEEVFWRSFLGEHYILADRVVIHDVPAPVQEQFRQFIRHVLLSADTTQQNRYLAKNNNDLLRLPSLRRALPDAAILLPFREPLQQALSLQRQHELFLAKHAEDPFSMAYMGWLGHYEFGLGHKRYEYSDSDNPHDPAGLDYWLQCWIDAYEYALRVAPGDALFLGYEQICAAPLATFSRLHPRLGLETDPAATASYYTAADTREAIGFDPALYARCRRLHEELVARHETSLRGG